MKAYYTLTVHGDSDINLSLRDTNYPIDNEHEVFYFKTMDTEAMIRCLRRVVPTQAWPDKGRCVLYMDDALEQMIRFLQHWKPGPLDTPEFLYRGFGGNQFVRLETKYMPEEIDFLRW